MAIIPIHKTTYKFECDKCKNKYPISDTRFVVEVKINNKTKNEDWCQKCIKTTFGEIDRKNIKSFEHKTEEK